jgi:hypothetical protein
VRALLESGADPTIATHSGITPMVIAKHVVDNPPEGVTAEDCQDCVEALEVRSPPPESFLLIGGLRRWAVVVLWVAAGCGAGLPALEGPAGGGCGCELRGTAGVEPRTRGEGKRRRVEAVPEELRGRAAAGGGEGLPGVSVVPVWTGGRGARTRAALLGHAVQSLKPGVFEELMAMMG